MALPENGPRAKYPRRTQARSRKGDQRQMPRREKAAGLAATGWLRDRCPLRAARGVYRHGPLRTMRVWGTPALSSRREAISRVQRGRRYLASPWATSLSTRRGHRDPRLACRCPGPPARPPGIHGPWEPMGALRWHPRMPWLVVLQSAGVAWAGRIHGRYCTLASRRPLLSCAVASAGASMSSCPGPVHAMPESWVAVRAALSRAAAAAAAALAPGLRLLRACACSHSLSHTLTD